MLIAIGLGLIVLILASKVLWWVVKLPFALAWGLLTFVLTPLGFVAVCLVVAALLL